MGGVAANFAVNAAPKRSSLADLPQPNAEQLSSINETVLKNLYEAKDSLDNLLNKVRGAQPCDPEQEAATVAQRHLLNDAYRLRDLSHLVLTRIGELHNRIGL